MVTALSVLLLFISYMILHNVLFAYLIRLSIFWKEFGWVWIIFDLVSLALT